MKEDSAPCTFIGVDLAWSKRNSSGLACLLYDGNRARLLASDCKTTDGEITSWIEGHTRRTTWLGIDAPIIAPNPPKTARPVDKIVSSLFGRFHAGVYPGNRERCARPIRLCRKLTARGFSPDPFSSGRRERVQLEIFPHLVQVALLARSRIIKYKKGAKLHRAKGLKELQRTIAEYLPRLTPPLKDSANLHALLGADPRMLKGKQLKALEDQVDALLCAYMTLYFWFWGEEKCQVFGDLASGYIIGPKQTESKSCS
jgi:predicted RNase H-like nuclease